MNTNNSYQSQKRHTPGMSESGGSSKSRGFPPEVPVRLLSLIVRTVVVAAALLAFGPAFACRADGLELRDFPAPTLSLNIADALARVDPPSGGAAEDAKPPAKPGEYSDAARCCSLGYGRCGSRWWTIGAAFANDFKQASDFNAHLAFSQFLADEFEFAVEVAGWYFHQPGDDTEGVSGSMVFRWHAWHPDDFQWTVFLDAGIGILGAFNNVPDGGTGFNFLPRVGAGFTWALDDSVDGESRGSRLMVGVRYHHISNARIGGDSRNPARDGVAVYAAIVFPF